MPDAISCPQNGGGSDWLPLWYPYSIIYEQRPTFIEYVYKNTAIDPEDGYYNDNDNDNDELIAENCTEDGLCKGSYFKQKDLS
jgi:hypothetical protein